jgi:hypothetical protein
MTAGRADRARRKARRRAQGWRWKETSRIAGAELHLARAGEGIRLRKSRSIIGEPFEQVRRGEVLVTRGGVEPIVLSIELVESVANNLGLLRAGMADVWAALKGAGRKYASRRPPVRHPKWYKGGGR